MKSPWEPTVPRALGALLLAALCAVSASRGAGVPYRAAAASLLDQFRRSLWAEPVYLEFTLTEMPRRGEEHVFRGRLWGGRTALGAATRMEIDVGKGGYTRRILIQSGPEPAVWSSEAGSPAAREDAGAPRPLAPGLEMTAFDIQMPYLYWLDSEFTGISRMRGRETNVYVFTPPAEFAAANPGIRSVRAYLDAQYNALVQSEVAGPGGMPSKTLSLLELRKVGERWILKDVDVRNDSTRDKSRLSVTAVAVGIPVDTLAFDPLRLGDPVTLPPRDKITRVAP